MHACKPKMFQMEQRNLNEKHLNLLFCDPRCLVLQAVQKSNGVCVHTKPTSNPCSSRSVWKPCSNCYGESDVFKQFRFGIVWTRRLIVTFLRLFLTTQVLCKRCLNLYAHTVFYMYYLQHERPCRIGYTRAEGESLFIRYNTDANCRSNFKNKRCLSRENQS